MVVILGDSMTGKSIGGRLDHRALALLHRPTDPAVLAREVRQLAVLGLTARDIAQALGLAVAEVHGLLTEDAA